MYCMAPILIKRVVSVTSEDPVSPAANLLPINSSVGKKWLCAHDNKSRRSEVVLELAKRSKITSIEIGNFGSAFVEVCVSNSVDEDYTTLLPSSMLMTVADSRSGRGKTTTLKCRREKLSQMAVDKKWILVKIQIYQKYNIIEQFGLQHVAFHNDVPASTHTPIRHAAHTPTHAPTPHTPSSRHRLPSLPSSRQTPSSSEQPQKLKNGNTPKRPPRQPNSEQEEDYEFAGIERQSRLFKNCVRGKSKDETKHEKNPILSRISSEKSKYVDKLNYEPTYQRTRLLKKELPKAEVKVDFAESFKEVDKLPSLDSLSAFDDESEIGDEVEERRGWGKRKGRGKKHPHSMAPHEWISKRKKMAQLINKCDALVKEKHLEVATLAEDSDKSTDVQEISVATTQGQCCNSESVESVECPVCGVRLPQYAIEVHASTCGETTALTDVEPIFID